MTIPRPFTLKDRYDLTQGRIYLNGVQALVRLPIVMAERDRAAGFKTAGFVSGYRGSPLGGLDKAYWDAKSELESRHIQFQPGLNEDLAATAVWGSQQVNLFEGAKFDGVFSIFYCKSPGIDRSMDVLRHANAAGASRRGGVLVIAGDDHGCQSSTIPNQSDPSLIAAMIPILNPANVQEYLDFGILGFEMSRYSGSWVSLKAIAETVECSATVDDRSAHLPVVLPTTPPIPPEGLGIRWPDNPLEQERRLHGARMDAIQAFAKANAFDRIVIDPAEARFGIATTGKAYGDVRDALRLLGIDDDRASQYGIRLYKIGLSWPIEESQALAFADDIEEILVVEEKQPIIEDQFCKVLYNRQRSRQARIVGKRDEQGERLLPAEGELTPLIVAEAIAKRLARIYGPLLGIDKSAISHHRDNGVLATPFEIRTPFFCSGCPHNTSTQVPEGSRAMSGIGCHSLALFVPQRRTALFTQMGGEGANWIGQAPFLSGDHVFQNIGDGTFSHSGLLALRAAAAAGVNITYKILFNDAVAMTGGQPIEGDLTVEDVVAQVSAVGAKRTVVVSDEPEKYASGFGSGVAIRHREELDAVQKELRKIRGLTVIVYDQTCAAEKRRRRKRKILPDPAKRVFINDQVCEGCGDCSAKSNCISVQPLETDFGRKRQIDQSNCNKDFSCLGGFCPSFVTVYGGTIKRMERAARPVDVQIPEPNKVVLADEPYNILVTGVGGTGVVTIGALLGVAAHLDGKSCSVLDFTGMAQKNGAVTSHIKISAAPEMLHAARIGDYDANLLLGCDLTVSASPAALSRMKRGVTFALVNSHYLATSAFVLDGDVKNRSYDMCMSISAAAGDEHSDFLDARSLSVALFGDSIASNLMMLGMAFQRGLIPLSEQSLARAIELNGVSVAASQAAFFWGRLAVHDRAYVLKQAKGTGLDHREKRSPQEKLVQFAAFLTQYQNQAYAARFLQSIGRIADAERVKAPGQSGLAQVAAEALFQLMSYKDEYEVARLYADTSFLRQVRSQFDGRVRIEFNLAPPMLSRRDKSTGLPKKMKIGAWMLPLFKLLASLKGLRGTAFDPFGYTAERKEERDLIVGFEALLRKVENGLTAENHAQAIELVGLSKQIRGFGHVKKGNIDAVAVKQGDLLRRFLEGSKRPLSGAGSAKFLDFVSGEIR
jgi:indolepyruvate ferredoxin oxidoreductase